MTKSNTINLAEIASDVYREFKHLGLTKDAMDEVSKAIFDTILTRTSQGEYVNVRNFGTFAAKLFKGRKLKTPLMKKATTFPDMFILRFKQSTTAKTIINERAGDYEALKAGKKIVRKAPEVVEGEPVKRGPGRPKKVRPEVESNVVDITSKSKVKAAPVVEESEEETVEAPAKAKKAAKAVKSAKTKKAALEAEEAPKKAKKVKAPVVEEDEIEDLDVDAEDEEDEIDDLDDDNEIEEDAEDDEILDLDEEDDEDETPAPKAAKKAKAK